MINNGSWMRGYNWNSSALAGPLVISDTTQSTSVATGSIITAGGVGIAKNLWVGGTVNGGAASFTTLAASGEITQTIAGVSNPIRIGRNASTTYGMISFNALLGSGSAAVIGLTGGGAADLSLYYLVPSLGEHSFRINDVQKMGLAPTGLTVANNLTVGASTFVVTAATGAVAFTGAAAIGNATSGAAVSVQNTITSGTTVAYLTSFSQGFTTSGTEMASSFRLFSAGSGGLTLLASAGVMRFYAGSATVQSMSITGTAVAMAGALAITGALTGVTTAALSSYIEGTEMAAPAAPAADKGRIFFQDNGAGKTQLMCIFASGAAQQLAIQP